MKIKGGKYLTFLLGQETYGIPINMAKEIIGMMEITNLPKTKEYIKGVINLRGKIIPVLDLRLKFGMTEKPYSDRTCIIVIEVIIANNQRQIGIIVDLVTEVIQIQKDTIEPPPEFGAQIDGDFLTGIGKINDRVILILDIEKVLNHDDQDLLKKEITLLVT